MQTDFSHVFGEKSVFSWRKGYKIAETLGVFGFYAYLCHRKRKKGKYQSGQMGQTVNLLAYAFGGSNPSLPTLPTQRQPVVASVLFCTWPVYFVQSVVNGGREVGGGVASVCAARKHGAKGLLTDSIIYMSLFMIYKSFAESGSRQGKFRRQTVEFCRMGATSS